MSTFLSAYANLGPLVPLGSLATSIFIYSIGLHFRALRRALLAPKLFCDYLSLVTATAWPHGGPDSLWGLLICIWACHSFSVQFLERDDFIVDGKGIFRDQTWWCKLWMTWNNCRLLLTSRAERRIRPSLLMNQSRWTFAGYRAGKLFLYIFFNDVVQPHLFPGAFSPLLTDDFNRIKQTYFRRLIFNHTNPITLRETYLRSLIAVHWAIGATILVDGAHTILSLFFVVVLRANRPEEWPTIYGDIRKACTLRGFWGDFWHRLVVLPYTNLGELLACRGLGLKRRSLAAKLLVACTIFTLSGVVHGIVSWALGDEYCWHLDIFWFVLNFVACTAEGFVLFQLKQRNLLPKSELVRKCIGFTWVYLFFFWSVPKWQYPKMYWTILKSWIMF